MPVQILRTRKGAALCPLSCQFYRQLLLKLGCVVVGDKFHGAKPYTVGNLCTRAHILYRIDTVI